MGTIGNCVGMSIIIMMVECICKTYIIAVTTTINKINCILRQKL